MAFSCAADRQGRCSASDGEWLSGVPLIVLRIAIVIEIATASIHLNCVTLMSSLIDFNSFSVDAKKGDITKNQLTTAGVGYRIADEGNENSLCIFPLQSAEMAVEIVLTAHPTQINRRALQYKHLRISHLLEVNDRKDLTQEDQDTLIEDLYTGKPLPLTCTPIRLGSWMGGDRDGNPNVTAKVTRDVSLLSRWMAIDLYTREVDNLRFELSMNQCSSSLAHLAHDIINEGLLCVYESASTPVARVHRFLAAIWGSQRSNRIQVHFFGTAVFFKGDIIEAKVEKSNKKVDLLMKENGCYLISNHICTEPRATGRAFFHSTSILLANKTIVMPITERNIPRLYFNFASRDMLKARTKAKYPFLIGARVSVASFFIMLAIVVAKNPKLKLPSTEKGSNDNVVIGETAEFIAKRDAARKRIMGNIQGAGKVDSDIGADGSNDLKKAKKKRARPAKNKDVDTSSKKRRIDELSVKSKDSTRRKSTRKVKMTKGGKGKVEKKVEKDILTNKMRAAVRKVGFGKLLTLNLDSIPIKLGHFVVDNLDTDRMVIVTEKGDIKIDRDSVSFLLDLPEGGIDISTLTKPKKQPEMFKEWKNRYPTSAFPPSTVVSWIEENNYENGDSFVLDFLLLFITTMVESWKYGSCKISLLSCLDDGRDVKEYDWCGYILNRLKVCKKEWIRDDKDCPFIRPLTILTGQLCLLESVMGFIKKDKEYLERALRKAIA
ncbi:hypothetical protein SSX86_002106 [Deinandra increscens subsp. villosa]|uniref:Phosphoenolpyruvate carboxylase n=1 Tax=Deinandra increscens subsp. villosa TaxID=3103831 RepID=A0AAP0DNE3_9ASTR